MNRIAHALAAAVFLVSPIALAQTKTDKPEKPEALPALQGRPDVVGEDLLGASYQNPLAGIAFRVPGKCAQVAKKGDEIAHFANMQSNWELTVNKAASGQPLPLTGDKKKMGLLEVTAARLQQGNAGIEIFRQEASRVGENMIGIIAAAPPVGTKRVLLQQAIVQANDQLYYTFTFTTPAAATSSGKEVTDPAEQVAAESFSEMLGTIKLLDRGAIAVDQKWRLYCTRQLFTALNEKKLRSVLIPEQWLRLMHNGHDIGYTYIVEEEGSMGPFDGVKIGIRSRSYPDQATQVDGETWYFVSFDRKHETWRTLAWVQNVTSKASDQFTEIGSSDVRAKRKVDRTGQVPSPDKDDKAQPAAATNDIINLEVQTVGKSKSAAPFKQDVSPWYLPQALGHLLPRLLPLREPSTFMFGVYVSDKASVWERYLDVGTEQEIELGGKKFRAVPITDRVGMEGSATIHYVTQDGKYVGSVNKDSKISILPTDSATLQKIWENKADLTRPREMQPAPAGPAAKN